MAVLGKMAVLGAGFSLRHVCSYTFSSVVEEVIHVGEGCQRRGLKESPGERYSRILFLYGYSGTEYLSSLACVCPALQSGGLSGAFWVCVQLLDVARVCVCRICFVLGVVCVV